MKITQMTITKTLVRTTLMKAVAIVFAIGCGSTVSVIADEPEVSGDKTVLIKAEVIHTGTGEILRPGCVLIRDGKIVEIGESLSVEGVKVVEVKSLIPGLVDAASRIGAGRLDDERTDEITPDLASVSIVDWKDIDFLQQLSGGTTCVHLTPGTSNVVAGLTSAVKTAGTIDRRIVAERTGLAISVCSDPASGNNARSRPDSIYIRQPTNRMGVVWMLRNAFHATQNDKFASPAMKDVTAGTLPVFAVSRTQHDIQALMTLADEFSFHPTLIGGQECWKVTDEIAERKMSVILQRVIPGSSRGDERTRISADMAARLNKSGATFCLSGGDLLDQMRFAVRFGLPAESALASITASPAAILKIDDRVGSIVVGKDADLVAMTGDPLEFSTAIQWVMVDGAIQFEQAGN
ncbi:MAG: amidohydrolase family protein [Planctomyces sp.]|nr:amidohydrolase family protein [Planctomyces sp.]